MGEQAQTQAGAATPPSFEVATNVLDRTGLTGNFDFKLEWTPDEGLQGRDGAGEALPADSPRPVGSGPTIFTALQEQLGLKLESQKGLVEVLVIDRVEKASGN